MTLKIVGWIIVATIGVGCVLWWQKHMGNTVIAYLIYVLCILAALAWVLFG